jgi:molybdenum cofactor synthesis domain-containing protein
MMYFIGKYEVTARQYAQVMAQAQALAVGVDPERLLPQLRGPQNTVDPRGQSRHRQHQCLQAAEPEPFAASGEHQTEILRGRGRRVRQFVFDGVVVVSGDEVEIRNALNTAVIGGVDLVISVGGTGVTPRDVAPEATGAVLDRELPGIAEALRASGVAAGSTDAGLSRGLAGISGSTLVVNLADSRAAVRDGMATLGPLAAHVIAELSNLEM